MLDRRTDGDRSGGITTGMITGALAAGPAVAVGRPIVGDTGTALPAGAMVVPALVLTGP